MSEWNHVKGHHLYLKSGWKRKRKFLEGEKRFFFETKKIDFRKTINKETEGWKEEEKVKGNKNWKNKKKKKWTFFI